MTSDGGIDDEEEESSEQSSKRDYDRDDKSLMVFLFLECHMSSLAGIGVRQRFPSIICTRAFRQRK